MNLAPPAERRGRLDLEDTQIRYEEAWREFCAYPDAAGREIVLERFAAYWRARNGSTTGMGPHVDKLDADAKRMVDEEERRRRDGRP